MMCRLCFRIGIRSEATKRLLIVEKTLLLEYTSIKDSNRIEVCDTCYDLVIKLQDKEHLVIVKELLLSDLKEEK
jgi:hypothetical protein